ncbi:MAG: hypothetical protein PHF50_02165 [Patescibacteria group bacterium]|nr:hypothetical protein [Patescibacteria group bacterium]
MFDFFKKHKTERPESESALADLVGELDPAPKPSAEIDNIAIHVMPRRFRNQPVKEDSAKTTGFIIIISGVVFLLVASAVLYYFLFRKPSVTITQEPTLTEENSLTETEANQAALSSDGLTATGTGMATLPIGNEGAATTTATTTTETIPEETELSLRVGADSDNDGLTNAEELIFNTVSTVADTDGDGYTDGSELINLYNPAGAGKLTASTSISLYENKTFNYDLLYPAIWQISINGGDDSLMFRTGDNQFVQIIVQPNVNKQTLDEWYIEQIGVFTISETDRISGANWQGLKTPDGLNVYLMDKKQNYIFSLTYNPGDQKVLEYFNIFQMMVKSFNL